MTKRDEVEALTALDRLVLLVEHDLDAPDMDDLLAEVRAIQAENERLREALVGIRIYANDTLTGRTDGPETVDWMRDGVIELRDRADAALGDKTDG